MWGGAFKALTVTAAILATSACHQASASTTPTLKPVAEASRQWQKLAAGFIDDYMHAQPFFAAQSGLHQYDGQLPDLSAHGIKREISRLHEARDQIAAVDPKPLEPRERFDRDYLLAVIDKDLFFQEKARYPFTNPYWYLNNIDPDLYVNRNYAPLDVRLKAYIRYARGIPKMAADIEANLQAPLPKTFLELGIADFGGFAQFYAKDVAPVFASVGDADLQKQLADADSAAAAAMTRLQHHLVEMRKSASDAFPLGKDLYAQMLADTERVDIPIARIEAAGRADLARNLAALKAECGNLLPGGRVDQCIAKVAADKPKDGPVQAARGQLADLRQYVIDHRIASIPGNEQVLVAEAPAYNRSNSAFIQVPGPYDQGVASVYNIAPPDPQWSKAEQAAYIPSLPTLLFTSVHEVWPGHFLQFLHSNANPSKLEAIWVGYAFAEGWAHYCEELMIEEGLAKDDPGKHIGQITDALLRDVRLLSSIGMHTEGMTVAQSEKMFREQAYQDPGNARQQAARGTYDPAYLNYTLGKLMIRKLRSDWLAKTASGAAPGGADDKTRWYDFHEQFLSYGGPPIPLVRREMLGDGDGGGLLERLP